MRGSKILIPVVIIIIIIITISTVALRHRICKSLEPTNSHLVNPPTRVVKQLCVCKSEQPQDLVQLKRVHEIGNLHHSLRVTDHFDSEKEVFPALSVADSVDHPALGLRACDVLLVFNKTQTIIHILEDSHHLLRVDRENFAHVDAGGGVAAGSDYLEIVPICLTVGLVVMAALVVVVDIRV